MKHWINRLLNNKPKSTFPVVWDRHLPSIYQRIAPTWHHAHPLASDNKLLEDLPVEDSDDAFWLPGAFEGSQMYLFGLSSDGPEAVEILAALQQLLVKPSLHNMQQLYQLINQDSPLHYIDELLKAIPGTPGLNASRLNELILLLSTESPDRNVVKFAMALMVYFPQPRNVEVLQILARHDEFTLFGIVALLGMIEPEQYRDIWYSMAQRVDGWGRIQLMERMPETLNATLRHWLLRKGFSNSIMTQYTALKCAIHGELLEALINEDDDDLLTGAAEILSALLIEGPMPGMSAYPEGGQCCLRYLHHIRAQSATHPLHYLTAKRIAEWARSEETLEASLRAQLTAISTEIESLEYWDKVIDAAFAGRIGYEYKLAIDLSRARQRDPFPVLFERQLAGAESNLWYSMMQTELRQQAAQVCRLAESQFDLNAIASGAALSAGTAAKWCQYSQLNLILHELKRFPDLGWPLLKAALCCPVVRNRQMAINTLETWSAESLAAYGDAIAKCIAIEPHKEISRRLKGLQQRITTGSHP